MQADDRKVNWPLPSFQFSVQIGKEKWSFKEVGNIATSVETLTYRHGRSGQTGVYKIPGYEAVENVTLKRGVFIGDTKLFDWFKSSRENSIERKDITISLLNQSNEPEIVWFLSKAFPIKLEGGNFNSITSGESAVSIEMVTLTFEEFEIQLPS